MPKKKVNPIETYVDEVVTKTLENRKTNLTDEDAKKIIKTIINSILPEIEIITSKVVLKHLHALATYVQINLKDPKEK